MLVFQGVNDWGNSSYHRLILRHSTNSSRNFLHRKKTRWWFPTIISYFRPYCGNMSYLTFRLFSDGLVQPPAPRKKKTSRFSKDSEEAKKETKHDSQKCLGPIELSWRSRDETHLLMKFWVVATQIFFIITPKIGEDLPILTNIFQRDWNHQLELICRGDF